jgi:hydrogen peroxide-dependent heme synthase
MTRAVETLEGWYALHDVRRFDRSAWERSSPEAREEAARQAAAFFRKAETGVDAPEGGSALFRVLGHKGDLLILHLRPTLEDLHGLEEGLSRLALARFLPPAASFVSVVELSQHGGGSGEDEDGGGEPAFSDLPEWVQQRLKPPIPDMRHICFYPMNKRRGERNNWFTLSPRERAELMESHGTTGRKYAGRIVQMITGAMGLDDWEWGVTLFAHDPLQFKKLVYEMRFDRVSALYADFGPFYTGIRTAPDDLADILLR